MALMNGDFWPIPAGHIVENHASCIIAMRLIPAPRLLLCRVAGVGQERSYVLDGFAVLPPGFTRVGVISYLPDCEYLSAQ